MKVSVVVIYCLLAVTLGLHTANARRRKSSSLAAQNCTVLPKPSSTSSQVSPPEEKLQQILLRGLGQLDFEQHNKTAIFVLGNTGSGKTTLTQTLNGNLSQLHAVLTQSGQLVIIDDQERIGLPTTTSKTLVPEYVVNPENNVSFYDCPGFDDNRGAKQDIAAMYFVNAITKHVTQAKFLFVVTHSSVIPGNDRLDFDLLVTHASQFLMNMSKFNNSIGLVVTKVSRVSVINGEPLEDDDILFGIVGFLEQYHSTLAQKLEEEGIDEKEFALRQRKFQFVEALLQEDDDENFPKIWFLKHPPKCGRYSDMPYYIELRKKMTDLYMNNLEYSPTETADFGFTLKDKTLLEISDNYIPEIRSELENNTVRVINELMETFNTEFEIKFESNETIKEALLKINDLYEQLSHFNLENAKFSLQVGGLFDTFGYSVPESYMSDMGKHEDVLKFYEKVTMSKIVKPSLNYTLSNLQTFIRNLRENALLTVQQRIVPGIVGDIGSNSNQVVEELMKTYQTDFHRDFNSSETDMREALLKLKSIRTTLTNFVSMQNHSHLHSQIVPELFRIFQYAVPEYYVNHTETQENWLKFYENVTSVRTQHPLLYPVLLNLQTNIRNLEEKTWEYIRTVSAPEISTRMNQSVNQLLEEVMLTFNLNSDFDHFYSFEDENFNDEVRQGFMEFNDLRKGLTEFSLTENVNQTFSTNVQRIFDVVNHTIADSILASIRKDEDLLEFYGQIVGVIPQPSLETSLSKLKTHIGNFKNVLWAHITDEVIPRIFSEIKGIGDLRVSEMMDSLIDGFHSDMSLITMPTKVEVLKKHYSNVQALKQKWRDLSPPEYRLSSSPVTLASEISLLYSKVGFGSPEKGYMQRLEELLDIFGEQMGSLVKRPLGEWLTAPNEAIVEIGHVFEWYEFLVRTNQELKQYNIQKDFDRLGLSRIISSSDDAVRLVKRLRPSLFTWSIDEIFQNHADDYDKLLLTEIVSNAFSTETLIQCQASTGKALVKGNFVKFTDFMGSRTELASLCHFELKELKIFASEVVYFDSDIHGKGNSPTITVVADKWEIIGNRKIDLIGSNGESYSYISSRHGQPGRPGKNGGSFYGIYGSISNARHLTINVSGGNGGDGQQGADGDDGYNGSDARYKDMPGAYDKKDGSESQGTLVITLAYNQRYFQYAGSSGGSGDAGYNGGTMGFGGYAGLVSFVSGGASQHNEISIIRNKGINGMPGKGGKGGKGGKDGHSYGCYLRMITLVAWWDSCGAVPKDTRASNGRNGYDGYQSVGRVWPVSPTQSNNFPRLVFNDFRSYVLAKNNVVGKQFVSKLNGII